MRRLLLLLLLFGIKFTASAQEQITDFDSLQYWYSSPYYRLLKDEQGKLYFWKSNFILEYDIERDSLKTLVTLPVEQSQYSFFKQQGDLYAYNRTSNPNGEPVRMFYFIDTENGAFNSIETDINLYSFFETENGILFQENAHLLRCNLDKGRVVTVDTLFLTQTSRLDNPNFYFLEGINSHTSEFDMGVYDRKGIFHSFSFPELEGKKINSVRELEGGFLLNVNQDGINSQEQYFVKDSKIFPMPDAFSYGIDYYYYKVNGKWIEVLFDGKENLNTTITINKIEGRNRTLLTKHEINTYRKYISVGYMSPGHYFYSNNLLLENKLYFLGNDVVRGVSGESNLKLFEFDFVTGKMDVTDANVLLNKDLYSSSFTMGTMGFELVAEGENIIVHPNRRGSDNKYNTYSFDTVRTRFNKIDTRYDPRLFVKTGDGYYSAEMSILLNHKKEYFRTIGVPTVNTNPKSQHTTEELYFGKIIETDEILYFIHTEKGKYQVSTYNAVEPIKTHKIFNNFRSITNIETIECEERHLVAVYGMTDTLATNGIFLYGYDLKTGELSYLGASSHRLSGLGRTTVHKKSDSFLIYGSNFFIETDFSQADFISNFQLLEVLSDNRILILKDRKLIKYSGTIEETINLGVSQVLKVNNKYYLLTEDGLGVMDKDGKVKEILKGKPKGYGNFHRASKTSVFLVLDAKAYLLNTESDSYQVLDIPDWLESFSNVIVKDKMLIGAWWNNETKLLSYDLLTKITRYTRFDGFHKVLFNPESENYWIVEEKYSFVGYGKENLNYLFKTLENGSLKTVYHLKSTENIYFDRIENNYFKSHLDNRIYYFNTDDLSFTDFKGDLSAYTELQTVLNKGKSIDLLQVRKTEKTEEYDIVEVNRGERTAKVVKKNIQTHFKPLTYEDSFYYADSSSSGLRIYYTSRYSEKLEEEYVHKKNSPIEEYKNLFTFKNNVFSLGLSDMKGYQLYKLSNREIKGISDTTDVILANENPIINFSFYPNPTADFLTINATVESGEKYKISVFSTGGKMLKEYQSTLPQNIDFSGLKTGVYLINVTNSKESRTFRVIKN